MYKKLNHVFKVGEVVRNNNGYDYKVLEVVNHETILFERVKDGEKVKAMQPNMFSKNDNGNVSTVLEWGRGIYL